MKTYKIHLVLRLTSGLAQSESYKLYNTIFKNFDFIPNDHSRSYINFTYIL